MNSRAWHEQYPTLISEIRTDLREKYPTLHLLISGNKAEICGIFPVRSPDDKVLDRYKISIELPPDYPESLPIVREVGERISQNSEHHINQDGTACVFIPDDRWRCFPIGTPFVQYLDGPLYNFFLSQTVYAKTGQWIFGEWSHGNTGIYEYYRWLCKIENNLTVRRFLHILAKNNLKKHYECPCGSGKLIRYCCLTKIRDLREKISPKTASHSMNRLGKYPSPYKRSKLNQSPDRQPIILYHFCMKLHIIQRLENLINRRSQLLKTYAASH